MRAKEAHDVVTLLASTTVAGPQAATESDAVRLPRPANGLIFVLNVTAAKTDAADTLDLKVQTMIDGVGWVDVCYFTQVLGNGGALKHIGKIMCGTAEAMFVDAASAAGDVRHLFGDEWRVSYVTVDADADAEFTFGVTALAF